ncbi:MAG: HD domain-containing protein [Patescibacteria group bacterium]
MEIPKEIESVSKKIAEAGFESYLVGGCVRDYLLDKKPKDWDFTTNAKPEEILKIFPDSVYENQFGTVGVKTRSENSATALVEVTTFRKEGKYTDKRHPDEITFAKTVEEDLSRRDFTVNAIAIELTSDHRQGGAGKRQATSNKTRAHVATPMSLIDPFGGQKDLEKKIIRAVGNADERFKEDALRLMRAVRFSAQLGFEIEKDTASAAEKNAGLLEFIAKERIAEELSKLLMTENAADGIRRMSKLGLLKYVVPELEEGVEMEQNKHHIYTVFEHNVRALDYAAQQNFPLELRIASLLHDVGKPRTRVFKSDSRGAKTYRGKKGDWTFYQHQYAGEKMAVEILDRLKFPKKMIEEIALLVREHMFVYDPELVTEKGVRRLVNRVGPENIDNLFSVREADRIGSGVAKAVPYRLRHLKAMIEKVKKDPISVKMLKVNGNDVIKELKIEPGPKVGQILSILLEETLDNPKLNEKEKLIKKIHELNKFSEKELQKMMAAAKKKAANVQKRIDEEVMKKYFVK